MKNRNRKLSYKLEGAQLTRDQKPNDPEEFQRITNAGGRVQRITDENGIKIGPFRVWEMNFNTPGLAMSRSLGDSQADHLGIISTPIISSHKINLETDYFIVLASDGVWDVLENEEVIRDTDDEMVIEENTVPFSQLSEDDMKNVNYFLHIFYVT